MHVVLDTNGLYVSKRNDCFFFRTKKTRRMISPVRISSIAVMCDCYISSAAVLLAVKHQIPILYYTSTGRPLSMLWSVDYGSIATLRKQQLFFCSTPEATRWILDMLKIKHALQVNNLNRLANRYPARRNQIHRYIKQMKSHYRAFDRWSKLPPGRCAENIMGIEGAIARAYWDAFECIFREKFGFSTRTRQPAKDPINAILNYWYGMLYHKIEGNLLSAGLDPYTGFLHADQYNKPVLAYDVIEPFRPMVDRLLIETCIKHGYQPEWFKKHRNGVWLSKAGKRTLIPLMNAYLEKTGEFLGKKARRKNHIHRIIADLIRRIRETIPEENL